MQKANFTVNSLIYEEITYNTCKIGTSNGVFSNGAFQSYLYKGPAVILSIVQNKETKRNYKVIEISTYCFKNCSLLKHVSLPNTLKTIGWDAFYGTSIASLIVPRSVKTLNFAAFSSMKYLETITFEQGIELITVGTDCFSCCTKLKKIILPNVREPITVNLIMVNDVELVYCGKIAHKSKTIFQNINVEVYVSNKYPLDSTFGGIQPKYLDENDDSCLIYNNAYKIRCTSNNIPCNKPNNILITIIMLYSHCK